MLKSSSSSQLHLALFLALAVAAVTALAVPIAGRASGGAASAGDESGLGLASALRTQAETVARMVASPTQAATLSGDNYAADLKGVPAGALIPRPLLAAVGQLAAGAAFSSPQAQASLIMQRQRPVPFTVHEEGMAARHTSTNVTVGQALAGLGIKLTPRDIVQPATSARLSAGMHVYISYARNLRLIVDGDERIVYTHGETVGELLAQAGISLGERDRIYPAVGSPVRSGMTVSVITVRDDVEFIEEPIQYQTVYEYDASAGEGEQTLVQAGNAGYVRREYRIKRVNGGEVSRELVSEVTVPAQDEVISIGTRPPATPVPRTPAPAVVASVPVGSAPSDCPRTMVVWATWYTAESAGGNGITATGTTVYKGIVAVDPRVIPLGTRMYIPGYGSAIAADTGGGVKGNMIDLGYGAGDVMDWRSRWVEICILS